MSGDLADGYTPQELMSAYGQICTRENNLLSLSFSELREYSFASSTLDAPQI
jgi:hypothetical protein